MTPRVVVVGLGPGSPELVGVGTRRALATAGRSFVRTRRHPSATEAAGAESFDGVYDAAAKVDDVYPAIVEVLVDAALTGPGPVVYAVPGSPLVAEHSVELLRADPRVELEVMPAVSFVDLAWDRLAIDPFAAGVRLVDGHRFAVEAAGATGPLLVAQCDSTTTLSEMKLSVDDGPDVVVLARLGLPDESVATVPWADLDRSVEPDHLTCVWVPALQTPVGAELVRFDELVRTLRVACPWDREQTHASLTRHLIEESYEVLEALEEVGAATGDDGPPWAAYEHLEEELGDLLFQIVFHAMIAGEAGAFTLADVARGIHDKLVRRHPHVFVADGADPDAVIGSWERTKQEEKGRASLMDGLPPTLPALLAAAKVASRAASVGFDWPDVGGPLSKVAEELAEVDQAMAGGGEDDDRRVVEEVGDLLFSVVNVARHLRVDPEAALRSATAKFRARFSRMEESAAAAGVALAALDPDGWDRLWVAAKRTPMPGR